jgi:FkbM family methyltransferase
MIPTRSLKLLAKKSLAAMGLDVRILRKENALEHQIIKMCSEKNLSTLLDVGANTGQFASSLIDRGFQGQIISFEPLQQAYEELSRNAAKSKSWEVAPRCAVGSVQQRLTLYRTKNHVSSSLMPILPSHIEIEPDAAPDGEEITDIIRLDGCNRVTAIAHSGIFLKADTQGYELEVLRGATAIIEHVGGILLEASLVPLYQGSPTFPDLIAELNRLGFVTVNLFPGLRRSDGELMQVDILAKKETRRIHRKQT